MHRRLKYKTAYGIKSAGTSRFLLIAPHAGGDDRLTGRIARLIAERLQGGVIVNKFYFKPTNSRATRLPERAVDFNRLCWSGRLGRYVWKKKFPAMKSFYEDIASLCDDISSRQVEKPVAIYIHGMTDEHLGIDIGVGMKARGTGFCFEGSCQSPYYCSGVATIQLHQVKKLKKLLEPSLREKYGLTVGIGKRYPAWSKRISVQFHKVAGRNDYAMQLEINGQLRGQVADIEYVADLISEALKKIFC